MAGAGKTKTHQSTKSSIIQLGIIVALFVVLAPRIDSLRASLELMLSADITLFLGAVAVSFLSFIWSSFTYIMLAWKKIGFYWTLFVQLSTGFINRLVPAGLGALGANTLYLMRSGHSEGAAASIALMNNILGIFSSGLLVGASAVFVASKITLDSSILTGDAAIMIGATILIVMAIGAVLFKIRPNLKKHFRIYMKDGLNSIKNYRKHPRKLFKALFFQLLVTLTFAICIILCARSLDTNISLWYALVAISTGTLFGSFVPTPGGIGGNEAGITLVLTLLGYEVETAIAVAILYRLCTFWAPILPGYAAYRYAFANKKFI